MSISKHRLCVLDVEMGGRQMGREPHLTHDFLDNLEMGTLAARAFQAVSTLKVVKLATVTTETRVSHWKYEGGAITPILSEDQTESIIDSIISPLLQGASRFDVYCKLYAY